MVKQLLRKRLGRELLNYEEMTTVLCDCEQLINLRPLTYLSEDPNELIPITPMMFLNEARSNEVVDLDEIESTSFCGKFKHRQEIRQELRERFRREYLSLLVHKNVRSINYKGILVGDVVIVEMANKKRVHWPIARVIQTFPSRDGVVRSVKIRITKGDKQSEINRPIQQLYMLETSAEDIKEMVGKDNMIDRTENSAQNTMEGRNETADIEDMESQATAAVEEAKVTRSGRKIRKPDRFAF